MYFYTLARVMFEITNYVVLCLYLKHCVASHCTKIFCFDLLHLLIWPSLLACLHHPHLEWLFLSPQMIYCHILYVLRSCRALPYLMTAALTSPMSRKFFIYRLFPNFSSLKCVIYSERLC